MEDKHCFTPVKITSPVPILSAGSAAPPYTVKTLPNNADLADISNYTFVEYTYDDAAEKELVTKPEGAELVELAERAAAARRINFFKFAEGGINPKYIEKHDDLYAEANNDVAISDDKKYLFMGTRVVDRAAGGSKSARKGRKSARKGRKSARKSRRARGSRSKK